MYILTVLSNCTVLHLCTAGSDSSESDGLPVHVLAKEARKKKKKKLKTRRERNKHKALLKLTHHTTIRASESIVKEPSQHTVSSDSNNH